MTTPHTQLYDGIPMRGDLTITVRDAKTRKKIRRIAIRNKITFLAADVLVNMLAQRSSDEDPAYGQMHSMRMGISNTAVTRADTNLNSFEIGKELFEVNKVTTVPGELEFTATLEAGDANVGPSQSLQEAGLFTAGSVPAVDDTPGTGPLDTRMFSHQIHPAIPKTSAIVLEYSWRIAFTA
jgi:hypothetical protein